MTSRWMWGCLALAIVPFGALGACGSNGGNRASGADASAQGGAAGDANTTGDGAAGASGDAASPDGAPPDAAPDAAPSATTLWQSTGAVPPYAIAVDSTDVYWTLSAPTGSPVMKCAIGGCGGSRVRRLGLREHAQAVDGRHAIPHGRRRDQHLLDRCIVRSHEAYAEVSAHTARHPPSRRRTATPSPTRRVELIRRLTRENTLWGAERIRGELLKLGVHAAKRTLQKYMRQARGPRPWGQSWSTFLENHLHQICAGRGRGPLQKQVAHEGQ